MGQSVLMTLAIYIFTYTHTHTKEKKENKNRYYSIIKITTEYCGLEVGYPPAAHPA